MQQFIFGGDNMPKTPQELARLRAVAQAMTPRRTPQNAGEGIDSIGKAILYRSMMGKADKAETAGLKSAEDAYSSLFSTPDVAPVDTAAIPPIDSATATPAVVPPQVSTIKSPQDAVDAASANPKYDLRSGIQAAAKTLGIDPIDLATAISYETAGTFDPTKKGPTTQWGQHEGLIQFGEPQAEQFGVNWDDPLQSQLGPDGAVVKYLQSTGVKPGMGLLDIYSAINAGGVNRYDASDANNGGAPGTVADKVNNQMEGHRQKALALFADQAQQADPFGAQPGLNEQVPVVPVPDGFQQPDPLAMQQQEQQPVEVADNSNYFPPAPRKKVAQALSRLDSQKAFEVLNNPYLPEGRKETIRALLRQQFETDKLEREQELKMADPKYQLDLKKGELEYNNLKNPPKAKNLTDDEEKAMGLDPSGVYQAMPDNTIKTVREAAKPIDAVNAEKAQIELENLKSPKGKWNKLNDTTIVNDVTGETKAIGGDQPADFKDVTSLRKELQDLPSYKNLSQALPIYQSMSETAGRSSKASDLNLVYGMGKIFDPTSVVREGEQVMVRNTASLPDWFQGVVASFNGDSALTPETRKRLMAEAYSRVKAYDGQFQNDSTQFKGIAARNKFNEADVIPTFSPYAPWEAAPAASGQMPMDGASTVVKPFAKPMQAADPELEGLSDEELEKLINGGR